MPLFRRGQAVFYKDVDGRLYRLVPETKSGIVAADEQGLSGIPGAKWVDGVLFLDATFGKDYVPISQTDVSHVISFDDLRKVVFSYNGKVIEVSKEDFEGPLKPFLREVDGYVGLDVTAFILALQSATKDLVERILPKPQVANIRPIHPKIVHSYNVEQAYGGSNVRLRDILVVGASALNTEEGLLRGYFYYGFYEGYELFAQLYFVKGDRAYVVCQGHYESPNPTGVLILEPVEPFDVKCYLYIDYPPSTYGQYVKRTFVVGDLLPIAELEPTRGTGEVVWQEEPPEPPDGQTCVFTAQTIWRPGKLVVLQDGIELPPGSFDAVSYASIKKVIVKTPPPYGSRIWLRYEIYEPPVFGYYGETGQTEEIGDLSEAMPDFEE